MVKISQLQVIWGWQEEKRQWIDGTTRLAEEVSSMEAQRDALRCQVAHLQLRLQEESYKATNISQVAIPSIYSACK